MRDICLDTAEIAMALGDMELETRRSGVDERGDPPSTALRTGAAPASQAGGVDLPPEEFRAAGYATIDRLVDYFAAIPERPAFAPKTPVELEPLFDRPAPEQGEPFQAILDDFEQLIVPNSTIQGSPRFFGWVNGGGTQVGALAEALAAGLNPNLGGWRAAQAATVIENRTIRWLADLMGLGATASGLFVSGGTMANTAALQMALRSTATWDVINEGLQSPNRPRQLTVYMADHEAHISLTKALDLLGLGRQALRKVPSNDDFTIDIAALERMLDVDIAAGMTPFCIVGHAGSINVGAIDDFRALARIARARGLWLHLDGACGALGAILPELRDRYAGIEEADSVSFDAHKWMGVPYECGCVLVKDGAVLRKSFAVSASYLHEDGDDALEPYDFFDRGPQMSRGFRAMKVWASLRHYGAEGYRTFFRRTIDNAKYLHALVSASDEWEVVQPEPDLYIYSFRYVGPMTPSTNAPAPLAARQSSVDTKLDPSAARQSSVDTKLDPSVARQSSVDTKLDPSAARQSSVDTKLDPSAARQSSVDTKLDPSAARRSSIDEELDHINAHIADEVKRRGVALVMTTRIKGRITQRLSIANHRTTRDDIRAVFEAMTAIGREGLAPPSP